MSITTPQNTKQQEIVKQDAREGQNGVEPSQKSYTVMEINVILKNRRAVMHNFRLHESSVDLLMRMITGWISNRKGSTVYEVCNNPNTDTTCTQIMIYNLIKKGLVECIGENKRTKLYAPTGECLQLMRKYFNLRDCA